MLQTLQSQDFQTLPGQNGTLYLPDGSTLAIHIEHFEEVPSARMRHSERMPFSLALKSLAPTDFIDGLCGLQVPELGRVDDIFVSRTPAMGRDPAVGYFCISFS